MKASLLKFLVSTFLFTFFSITALADPMKDQILISAPMVANNLTCTVLNVSDRTIVPMINISDHLEDFPPQEPFGLAAGALRSVGVSSSASSDYFLCVVEWVGTPDEIRASACASRYDVIVEGYTCLELR